MSIHIQKSNKVLQLCFIRQKNLLFLNMLNSLLTASVSCMPIKLIIDCSESI